MTRLPGCGTRTAARMWYLEPSCMLLVACMTVEWPLGATSAAQMGRGETTACHVRRDKAALIQRVQAPPGDRSSRKQPGQAWR